MGITMTITAECPEELFSTIKGCALMVADGVPAAVPQTPVASPTPAPVAIPANGVPQAAPSAPVTPVPVQTSAPPVGQTAPVGYPAASVPVTPPPSYTQDQIAKAGHSLLEAGKMTELIALLGRYGVQAVTELRPDQFGAVATELRAMGAHI